MSLLSIIDKGTKDMIYKHDLYDIAKAFINIRHNVKEKSNIEVLEAIISVLNKGYNDSEDNQIRRALRELKNLDIELWYYVYHDNIYTHHYLFNNENIYKLFKTLCRETILLLENGDFERAYDLIDAYHSLPEIVANNNFIIPKSYWRTYIKSYRIKWDKDFLKGREV